MGLHWSSCKVPLYLSDFNDIWRVTTDFRTILMTVRTWAAQLFHEDWRPWGRLQSIFGTLRMRLTTTNVRDWWTGGFTLTLILLTWRIWWASSYVSKWQMGFNSAFRGLNKNMNTDFPSHSAHDLHREPYLVLDGLLTCAAYFDSTVNSMASNGRITATWWNAGDAGG
jgi:hypothetical protein